MRKRPTTPNEDTAGELCLLGPRQLENLLKWVSESSVDVDSDTRSKTVQRWREAAAVYRELESSEPNAADHPEVRALASSVSRHAAKLAQTKGFRQAFDVVPVAFGLVELEKLVVSQYCVSLSTIHRLLATHNGSLSALKIGQLCLPTHARAPDFKLVYQDESEFVFTARDHDLRFLGAKLLNPAQLTELELGGHPQAAVALAVGASCNVIDVVRLGNRLVLNNGHHRAYALRALGVTHVPCVIQVCSSAEELALVANSEIVENSDMYFELPRPPLLRDFDNPALTHVVKTQRLHRQVRVSFKVESHLFALP